MAPPHCSSPKAYFVHLLPLCSLVLLRAPPCSLTAPFAPPVLPYDQVAANEQRLLNEKGGAE